MTRFDLIMASFWPILLFVLIGCQSVAPDLSSPDEDTDRMAYEVVFEGLEEDDPPGLYDLVTSISDTIAFQNRPPASTHLLRKRVEDDLPAMRKALDSYGYFKADLAWLIDEDTDPVRVVIHMDIGPVFRYGEVSVRQVESGSPAALVLPGAEEIGLIRGAPYRAKAVLEAREKLLDLLSREGRPFPKVVDSRIVADHAVDLVTIEFTVDPGPEAVFGTTHLRGLDTVDPDFVHRRIPWSRDQKYDSSLVEQARRDLIRTGLFAQVEFAREIVDEGGRLQLNLNLTERKHKTISGAAGYSTDFGPEAELAWEHRNVFGEGERLALALSVNEVNQSLTADLRSPDFLRGDQTLVIHSGITASNTDAFQSKELDNSAVVERRLTDDLTVGAGMRYRLAEVKEETTEEEVFGLFSIPSFLEWDYSDDLLEPSKGGRFRFALEPFVDTLGADANFLRYEASYRHYFELAEPKKVILAFRAAAGRIEWAQRSDIPKDELFYSGGGGSVRGYAFQTAGPLDQFNNPAGGLAKLEFSGELRYRVSESFGLAAFLDAGRAYGDKTPEFDEDLFYGAGLGVSYYTSIGPIRVDLATPLNKRPGIDDDFQVYISIGQAF